MSMIWCKGYKPDLDDRKDLIQYEWETTEGLVLNCWMEHSPAEKMSEDSPGYPERMYLIWCLVEGVDITPVLAEQVIKNIEAGALKENEWLD